LNFNQTEAIDYHEGSSKIYIQHADGTPSNDLHLESLNFVVPLFSNKSKKPLNLKNSFDIHHITYSEQKFDIAVLGSRETFTNIALLILTLQPETADTHARELRLSVALKNE
jgi:hypothetical protein